MKNLKNLKYWLFDLDNTLYSGHTKVFDQVDKKMTEYISKKLNLNPEEAKKIQQKVKKNSFGFDDFLSQIKQVQKMGSMKDLVGMIPGANKISPEDIDEDAFKGIEAIIQSMTPKERSQPKLLNHSRKKRIALGSGTKVEDVNRLIKQFEQMQKMMKMVQRGGAGKLMQMMKGV